MRVPVEDHIVAFGSVVVQVAIAFVLVRRSIYKDFPWFFSYIVYHAMQGIIMEAIALQQGYSLAYIWSIYTSEIFSLAISVGVIYEVFTSVLAPYEALNHVAKRLFAVSAMVLAVVAIALAEAGKGPGINRLAYAVFVSYRSLRVVQLGLLLILFALARSFGLKWRTYTFGIALGYGIYAAVDLILTTMRAELGESFWHLHSILSAIAFTGMHFIWLSYFLQRQEIAQPVRVIPYNDIAKWNEKLEELLKRKAA